MLVGRVRSPAIKSLALAIPRDGREVLADLHAISDELQDVAPGTAAAQQMEWPRAFRGEWGRVPSVCVDEGRLAATYPEIHARNGEAREGPRR
jgi:hypothetical protein